MPEQGPAIEPDVVRQNVSGTVSGCTPTSATRQPAVRHEARHRRRTRLRRGVLSNAADRM
ncbi:hypothetical protein [Streptomyces sp. TRM68416]|uniref:hypothetical protein n=1 Tax=Streptomyces sp. TRM68416 TaxID=2758412 RepID=UPI001661D600|nr:hypothetical protein [Streptomyces sp. TRM68416]MBD0839495.1 hypothetical protein [Streptomyces sp. TRM68416]